MFVNSIELDGLGISDGKTERSVDVILQNCKMTSGRFRNQLTLVTANRSPLKTTSDTPSLLNSTLKGEKLMTAEFEPDEVVTVTDASPTSTLSKLQNIKSRQNLENICNLLLGFWISV
jgi:hypothetical protein